MPRIHVPPPRLARRRAGRLALVGLAAAAATLVAMPAAAADAGVAAALARPEGPRVAAARDRVHRAERALEDAMRGVSASLAAEPAVTWGADVEDPAQLGASVALHAALAWTHDAAAVVRAEIDLVKARAGLQDARRAEAKEALELAGARLRGRLAVEAADRDVADARADLADAAASGDETSVAYAELDLRAAELDAAHERAELARLEREAQRLGVGAPPVFAPVAFALPAPDPAAVPAYRVLALEARRAAVLLERQRVFGVLDDVELAARYESRAHRYQLDASIGVDRGRPVAAVGAEVRNQQDDQWSIGLSMRIVLDDRTPLDLAAAERDAERAEAARSTWTEAFAEEAAEALRLARLAEDRLRVALATRDLRRREVDALSASGADASAAGARLARDTDRLYLAWLRYVEEVDDYLALVGAGWSVAGPLEPRSE